MSENILISAVEGNRQWLDGGAMFGNVPRAVWSTWIKPDNRDRIQLACRALLIEIGHTKILCETGIGAFFDPKLADRYGVTESDHRLLANLSARGITEADIDFVILSHLHFDHAGGLLPTFAEITTGGDRLLFPNAKYVVGSEAFARAEHPHPRDRASFIPGMVDKLKSSGRLIVVSSATHPDVCPDHISFRYSNGHTPGQMHTICRGEKETVIFAGDLIPGQAWVHVPVTMGYDRYAEMVIDEKTALYGDAVPNHWIVFYTHDAQVPASYIRKGDKGKFEADAPIANLNQMKI